MKRRSILAAAAVIVGGTLAASAPARAATPFSCIGAGPAANNIASGVEFNVAFNGDFPEVVVGQRFTINPAVQYKLVQRLLEGARSRRRARQRREQARRDHLLGRRAGHEHRRGPAGRPRRGQPDREHARALERRDRDRQRPALQRPVAAPSARRCSDLAGTANLSAADTFWTPKSAAPVEFSATPVGTLGEVEVADRVAPRDRRRGGADGHRHQRRPAPGVPDVDPLTAARAYGNLYVRLRLGTNRTSLDCATGAITVLDSSIAYSEKGNLPAADGGDRGRYTVLPAAAPRFAAVTPLATRSRSPASTASAATSGARSTPTTSRFSAADPGRTRPARRTRSPTSTSTSRCRQ